MNNIEVIQNRSDPALLSTGDFTIDANGDAFISQRKLAEKLNVNDSTLRNWLSRDHHNYNKNRGLDEKMVVLATTYFAIESKVSTKEAKELLKKIMEAGAKAWMYHEAGYKMEAKPQFIVPQTFSEALLLASQLAAEKEAALAKIEADKPKVKFAEAVRNMEGACPVGSFAKTIGFGRNRFFKKMRDDGILMANNLPYQRYIEKGYFAVIEQTPFTDSSGKSHPAFTTYITGTGQVWLEKKYRQEVEVEHSS